MKISDILVEIWKYGNFLKFEVPLVDPLRGALTFRCPGKFFILFPLFIRTLNKLSKTEEKSNPMTPSRGSYRHLKPKNRLFSQKIDYISTGSKNCKKSKITKVVDLAKIYSIKWSENFFSLT